MIRIRAAGVDDVQAILAMLQASASDQGFADQVVVTLEDLREDGFGTNPRFHVLVAEAGDAVAGMALYYINYSTWGSRLGLYLEDLYVAPAFRGSGAAEALMRRLARMAVETGCGRFQWVVHGENTKALRLYERLGARWLEEWKLMSLKGADLRRLAAEDL